MGTKTFSPKIHFFLKILTYRYTQKDMIHQNVHTIPVVTMVKKKYEFSKKPFNVMISFFVVWYSIYWMLLAAHVALYVDS